ncbi:hypothetical protein [Halosegnis sp.]
MHRRSGDTTSTEMPGFGVLAGLFGVAGRFLQWPRSGSESDGEPPAEGDR